MTILIRFFVIYQQLINKDRKEIIMIPYDKKYRATAANMLNRQVIAKAPTSISSLTTPTNLRGSVVSGSIKQNNVGYRVSAINEYGETIASDELKLSIGTSLNPIIPTSHRYTPGILPIGQYYYGVTATNEYGETNITQTIYVKNNGTPAPEWSDQEASVLSTGMLPSGTYFYSVTCVVSNKETITSTAKEVVVNSDNSSVVLTFKAVEGASSYNIYRRSVGNIGGQIQNTIAKRIGTIKAPSYINSQQDISYTDNGTAIGQESAPTFNATTSGIEISWEPILDAKVKTYKIYGRTSPNADDLKFIAEVPATSTSFKDQGYISPTTLAPKYNTSGYSDGAGVALTWNKVSGCTGYRIYGRDIKISESTGENERKGYLVTIADPNVTGWTDTGVISPDFSVVPPAADTTDGTRGILGSVIPDGETLEVNASGLLSVKGGIDSFLGRSLISNVADDHILVYNNEEQKWCNVDFKDLVFTIVTMTDGTIVPIDQKFNAFKDKIVETLNLLNSFNEQINRIEDRMNLIEEKSTKIENKIGSPFSELK